MAGNAAPIFTRVGDVSTDGTQLIWHTQNSSERYDATTNVLTPLPIRYWDNSSYTTAGRISGDGSVELLLGSLGTALATGFASEVSRAGLEVDDIELTVKGRLGNPLAHLGLGDGDPGFAEIEAKCFASTMADEGAVRAAWERTVERSPIAVTLGRATRLTLKLAIV